VHDILRSKAELDLDFLGEDSDDIPISYYYSYLHETSECEDVESMMTGAIRTVSSFSGVDGLIVADPSLAISGYGAVIQDVPQIKSIQLSNSPSGAVSHIVNTDTFGTRHRSMINFCSAHRGTLGFVVSQDGEIRAVTKQGSKCLMFQNVKVHDVKTRTYEKTSKRAHLHKTV
jgi:hypothetical protein